MHKILIFLFFAFFGVSCLADTVVLRSGKEIDGTLHSASPSNVHITVNGELMIFPTSTVSSIAFSTAQEQRAPDADQDVIDQLTLGSEILLKVLSVKVVDDARVDLVFQTLQETRLASSHLLQAGTLMEGHFPADSGNNWASKLKLDRALAEASVITLQHRAIVDVTSEVEPSVLYGRGPEVEDDLNGLPDLVAVSRIVRVRFSGGEDAS